MSSGILSAVISTVFTVKSRFISSRKTHAFSPPGRPMRCIIAAIGLPLTGSALITPTTGFAGVVTREMARARSYSSSRSRVGTRKGIASF